MKGLDHVIYTNVNIFIEKMFGLLDNQYVFVVVSIVFVTGNV